MSSGTENSTQTHDISTETIKLRDEQEPEMNSLDNEFSTSEVTHISVSKHIRQQLSRFYDKLRKFLPYWGVGKSYKLLRTAKLPVLDEVTRLLAMRTTNISRNYHK